MPKSVSELNAEAEDLDEGEGADERDRDSDRGMMVARQSCQEEEDDEDDDDDCFADGSNDFIDRFADDQGWCRPR